MVLPSQIELIVNEPLLVVIIAPIVGGALAYLCALVSRRAAAAMGALATGATLYFAVVVLVASLTGPRSVRLDMVRWPTATTYPVFQADILNAWLLALSSLLFFLIAVYSCGIVTSKNLGGGYFLLLSSCASAVFGLFLSGDLLSFYTFWEASVICSTFLVASGFTSRAAQIANKTFYASSAASVPLLLSFLWLADKAGTTEIAVVLSSVVQARPGGWELAALVLLATVAVRVAIVPLHGWFVAAMSSAHAPVAALVSAVVLQIGLYVTLRMVMPLLGSRPDWSLVAASAGLLTILVGSVVALRSNDLPQALAYVAVGQIGYVVLSMSLGGTLASAAAVLQTISYVLILPLLILAASEMATAAKRIEAKSWLELPRASTLLSVCLAIALLGVAGVPPLNGFASKSLAYRALLQIGSQEQLLMLLGTFLATALTVAAVVRLGMNVVPSSSTASGSIGGNSLWTRATILVLAAASVALGLAADLVERELLQPIISLTSRSPSSITLGGGQWTSVLATALLLAAFACGLGIYRLGYAPRVPLDATGSDRAQSHTRALPLLAPIGRQYWRLADRGIFDAISITRVLVNSVAGVAAWLVNILFGRAGR